jgi:copper homeostasis protein
MKDSILFCKQIGAQGVVFGILDKNHNLNLDQIQLLAEVASPLEVTIHKAIDLTPDPVASLRTLLSIKNINSVLTSGAAPTAFKGNKVIKEMLKAAKGSINIIAAGKITTDNLAEVHNLIGAHEYHGRRIVGQLG